MMVWWQNEWIPVTLFVMTLVGGTVAWTAACVWADKQHIDYLWRCREHSRLPYGSTPYPQCARSGVASTLLVPVLSFGIMFLALLWMNTLGG